MKQKVIQIGNSLGVIIPREYIREVGLREGSQVYIEKDPNGKTLMVSQSEDVFTSSITPEFLKTLKNINKRYKNTFEELANIKK